MTDVYLGLGSNLGDRHTLLLAAIEQLVQHVGRLVRCSSFIETEPWGFASDHPFLNAVAWFQTNLTPRELLTTTQEIERNLGRKEKSISSAAVTDASASVPHYTDRPIDIDILLYGDQHINEPDLKIPHPLMHERDFVMHPLNEIRNQ